VALAGFAAFSAAPVFRSTLSWLESHHRRLRRGVIGAWIDSRAIVTGLGLGLIEG